MLIANQPLLLQTDAAQMQKSASNAGNTGTKAASAARAANSSTVALSSSATAAMARPAQAGASTNSADGAKSRGTAKATSSNSSSASKPAAGRAALSTMHVAYNANQPNANVQPVAMFEGAEDHETSSGGGNAETHNAPNKASRDNVLATYSSLARVSLAADVKLKRVA